MRHITQEPSSVALHDNILHVEQIRLNIISAPGQQLLMGTGDQAT